MDNISERIESASLSEIVAQVADCMDLPQAMIANVVGRFIITIQDELADGRSVNLRGFGTFTPRQMNPVVRRLPNGTEATGRPVRLAFKPSPALKDRLNRTSRAG